MSAQSAALPNIPHLIRSLSPSPLPVLFPGAGCGICNTGGHSYTTCPRLSSAGIWTRCSDESLQMSPLGFATTAKEPNDDSDSEDDGLKPSGLAGKVMPSGSFPKKGTLRLLVPLGLLPQPIHGWSGNSLAEGQSLPWSLGRRRTSATRSKKRSAQQ